MTIDWKRPIETTDGRPARVLATDLADTEGNCVLVAILIDGSEMLQRLRPEGWSWPHRESVIIRNKRTKRESCSRCAGRMTAEDRHYYGDHCEDCARRESDAWDIIRRES